MKHHTYINYLLIKHSYASKYLNYLKKKQNGVPLPETK